MVAWIVGQNTLVRFENPRQFKTAAYEWDANTYFRSGNQYPAFSVLEGEATKDFDLNAWWEGTALDHQSHLVQDGRPDNRVFVRAPTGTNPDAPTWSSTIGKRPRRSTWIWVRCSPKGCDTESSALKIFLGRRSWRARTNVVSCRCR